MKFFVSLLLAIAPTIPVLSLTGFAQTSIPPGTILPARLNSTLNSQKAKPGQLVTARVMQDVPLPSGRKIKAGAKVRAEVIDVRRAQNGKPARLSLRFDQLESDHHSLRLTADLRAIASWMDVEEAQTPAATPDRATPPAWITTTLIGGEVQYGQGGPVARGTDVVGTALANGVLAVPGTNPESGCRGEFNGNSTPQAFWVFSSDACGVYGIANLRIAVAGRTNPQGVVTLESTQGHLLVRAGAGMLLRVLSTGQQ